MLQTFALHFKEMLLQHKTKTGSCQQWQSEVICFCTWNDWTSVDYSKHCMFQVTCEMIIIGLWYQLRYPGVIALLPRTSKWQLIWLQPWVLPWNSQITIKRWHAWVLCHLPSCLEVMTTVHNGRWMSRLMNRQMHRHEELWILSQEFIQQTIQFSDNSSVIHMSASHCIHSWLYYSIIVSMFRTIGKSYH